MTLLKISLVIILVLGITLTVVFDDTRFVVGSLIIDGVLILGAFAVSIKEFINLDKEYRARLRGE